MPKFGTSGGEHPATGGFHLKSALPALQIAARASAAENLAAQKRINRALCASKAASKVLEAGAACVSNPKTGESWGRMAFLKFDLVGGKGSKYAINPTLTRAHTHTHIQKAGGKKKTTILGRWQKVGGG